MDIKQLINKYYEGKASLKEENYLRNVLFSEEIEQIDSYTKLIFNAFSGEKEENIPSSVKTFSPTGSMAQKFTFSRKKWAYIASGIAACLAFVVGIHIYKYQQENTAYVIINGVRINDKKLAIQYVNDNFSEIDRSIEKGLAPLHEIEKIEDKLNKIVKNINY
jgi:hypothetical protein